MRSGMTPHYFIGINHFEGRRKMGNIRITWFKNKPVPSNVFLVKKEDTDSCIVIDPGSKDESELVSYILGNELYVDYIILTHEHFDHCWGVNQLLEKTEARVICTKNCAEKVCKPTNYFNKFYFDSDETYAVDRVDATIEDLGYVLDWQGEKISFIETKGHSPCGMCISIRNKLFTGDTLLLNTKPVQLKRNGASNVDFKESLIRIFSSYPPDTMVYPGHGNPFRLHESQAFYETYFSDSLNQ